MLNMREDHVVQASRSQVCKAKQKVIVMIEGPCDKKIIIINNNDCYVIIVTKQERLMQEVQCQLRKV